MASADEYAAWIVKNQDRKGTPEFETVAAAYKEAKGDRVSQIPGNVTPPPQPTPAGPSHPDMIGALEAAAAAGTGMLGGIAGQIAGVGRTLTSGKYGTPEGIRAGEETARSVSEALTYRPRTDIGQAIVEGVGKTLDASKLAGMPPAQGITAGVLAAPAARQAVSMVPSLPVRESPAMVGMGAAMTAADRLRHERAQALPVPLPLTKGMLTREFEQQRFERETGKDSKLGKPIRERHAELNQRILQNFEAFADETGAEAVGLRAVGQIVNDAVVEKANRAKSIINTAYEKARAAGELEQPVDVAPLLKYAEDHKPEAINAPIIQSLAAKVEQVMKPDGTASINDLEEVRKMIGALSGKDATNAIFGKDIKTLIDGITDGVGGDAYKRARALRLKYAKEFEDIGVIDKLLSTKPGTRDRAVAYEDVFQHSVLKGSLDDVRKIRGTLQTAGERGQQAWKELQGQTVRYIQDEVTKNVTTDERGNTVVSAARLNTVIRELDQDGKLDFVFGKKGGERMRALSDAAKDVLTFPPNAVNTSNTASVLLGAVGSAAMGHLPTAAATAIQAIKKARRSRAIQKRVEESLNPSVGP